MSQSDPEFIGVQTTLPGGTTMPAIEAGLMACASTHSGATAPDYADVGTLWLDTSGTPDHVLKVYDGTDWIVVATVDATSNLFSASLSKGIDPAAEELNDQDGTPLVP